MTCRKPQSKGKTGLGTAHRILNLSAATLMWKGYLVGGKTEGTKGAIVERVGPGSR